MKIATFNVNSVRARLEILDRWLKTACPDLLFLQELKTRDEFFPEIFFNELGYKSYYHGEKNYNGVGVLIKNENKILEDAKINFGFDENNNDDAENFATRVLVMRNKNFTILNTYVPQGKEVDAPEFKIKLKFFGLVKNFISRELDNNKNFIWLGDMNVAPEPIDVKHPETKKHNVCFCDEIRECYKNVRDGLELIDIFREFNKNPDEYTFYDYRYKKSLEQKAGWRIDHILTTQEFSKRFLNCYIDLEPRLWDKPSDHTPLVAELEI